MKLLIQAVLLAAVLGFLIVFVRGQHGARMRASKRLAFIAFLFLNAFAVLQPEATSWVAKHIFGVGRGADLLLYALIVAFVFAVLSLYLRLQSSEQRTTELVRTVAIRDAEILNRDRGLLPAPTLLAPTEPPA
ncbi:DUF2304 domain-containing protein [Planosporangium flavigriseum]|uniref:DUF2304 domain-containing protein n=1 Tax=Planosporangium flavigriseum TaxID=373681 RepID=A0A8J3LLC5_9ACTN|nr:DUF2304 domain-containing protein [Planosporangium flavigriseum]NJC65596.1 DUF2304 domain-containing protein [Planosporangium flavigriseum]GIG74757.1 hypothetical protein Pfl04_31610 [Planosporangium flavigriseum]